MTLPGIHLERVWIDEASYVSPDDLKAALTPMSEHRLVPHTCRRGRVWMKRKRYIWMWTCHYANRAKEVKA